MEKLSKLEADQLIEKAMESAKEGNQALRIVDGLLILAACMVMTFALAPLVTAFSQMFSFDGISKISQALLFLWGLVVLCCLWIVMAASKSRLVAGLCFLSSIVAAYFMVL